MVKEMKFSFIKIIAIVICFFTFKPQVNAHNTLVGNDILNKEQILLKTRDLEFGNLVLNLVF